jgi:hypothetical protein
LLLFVVVVNSENTTKTLFTFVCVDSKNKYFVVVGSENKTKQSLLLFVIVVTSENKTEADNVLSTIL